MMDLISVVIPIYNVEKYLKRCIDSVVNQTYKKIEIILVDDGSPDNCPLLCDEYAKSDSRVQVIHKKNGGLSDARNVGTKKAKGKYITYIDSDDYVDKDYIEYMYNLIKRYETPMAICSHKAVYDNGTILDKTTNEESRLDKKYVLQRILYDEGIDLSAWAKLYDIRLFKNVDFPVGRLFEDAATTYKLIDQCDYIACGLVSKYNYMIRNTSITGQAFSKNKIDLITSTKEMTDYIKNKYPDLEDAADRRLIYAYMSTLTQLAKSNEYDSFKEESCEMIDFIRKNTVKILRNSRVPKRDKAAALSALFGMRAYRNMWNIYSRITGRG